RSRCPRCGPSRLSVRRVIHWALETFAKVAPFLRIANGGNMASITEGEVARGDPARSLRPKGPLVYRQSVLTRVTHWTWAVALFFLLLSGLQIFNAHPSLYIGKQSGFEY